MTSSVQGNYYTVPQEERYETNEDIHFFPRCSTPISNPRSLYLPEENEPSTSSMTRMEKLSGYCEWKKHLEHEELSRQFKLRATGRSVESCSSENCTMISGYLEIILEDQTINPGTISRPAPIHHQMWLPLSYQTFFNPSTINDSDSNHNNNISHNNTSDNRQHRENPNEIQQPEQSTEKYFDRAPGAGVFRTARNPCSGSAVNAFLNILNNTDQCHHHHHHHHHHYNNFQYEMQEQSYFYGAQNGPVQCNVHNYGDIPAADITAPQIHPQMNISTRNFYRGYQYHQYDHHHHHHYHQAPFFAHSSSEIQRTIKYVNVPIHGENVLPVMMT